jgi:hypothetical protein
MTDLGRIPITNDTLEQIILPFLLLKPQIISRPRQGPDPIPSLIQSKITIGTHQRPGLGRSIDAEQVYTSSCEPVTKVVR